MKKITALILALCMIMSLASCGSSAPASTPDQPETPASTPAETEPTPDPAPTMTPEQEEEAEDEPADEPTEEPSDEPAEEPSEQPSDDPAADPDQPAADPEDTPDPPTPEVTPEPTPEPTPEATPAPEETPEEPVEQPEDTPEEEAPSASGMTLAILSNTFSTFAEEMRFPIGGGDYSNMTMDVPGAVNVTDTDSLDGLYGMPASAAAYIDEAAGMMHMMNANTFTAACYHLINAADMSTIVGELKTSIMNRQWMCGFPDTLIIVQVGADCVVSAFGNAELIEYFKTQLCAVYGCSVLVEESLA